MELRKLYKQGKSLVVVIPSAYLKILGWTESDHLSLTLLPDNTLRVSRLDQQTSIFTTTELNNPNNEVN
jgi:antitoxin component of MazEF toxin-antitoxin module